MPGAPVASPTGATKPDKGMHWHFLQCFGERILGEEVQDADIISAVEFDHSGELLATGDKGGRVVVFEKVPHSPRVGCVGMDQRPVVDHPPAPFEFRYATELQSHLPEFDYLKSLEIEEKINKIRWWRTGKSQSRFLLSTNDKTIKLWKMFDKQTVEVSNFNVKDAEGRLLSAAGEGNSANGVSTQLQFPRVMRQEKVPTARCSRVFRSAHAYHINSLSPNSDQETFISADDLRINLWNAEIPHLCFNIVDLKPEKMENLTEVITCAECHPLHCNIIGFTSSKGLVRLADMRTSALCDQPARLLKCDESQKSHTLFSEILNSVLDFEFSRDGRFLVTRDYLTVKLWDLNMDRGPVSTFCVHEQLRRKLYDLYENDNIFDKFCCRMSGDGERIVTGTYNNTVRVFGRNSGEDLWLDVGWEPMKNEEGAKQTKPTKAAKCKANDGEENHPKQFAGYDVNGNIDWRGKMLQMAWHPGADVLAVAACNSLFVFNAT